MQMWIWSLVGAYLSVLLIAGLWAIAERTHSCSSSGSQAQKYRSELPAGVDDARMSGRH